MMKLLLLYIIVLKEASSSASRSSYNDNGFGFGDSHMQREERRRYANLPPTVFAPGGRLHGVERVAREAMLLDDDEDEKEGRLGSTSGGDLDNDDGDGMLDEEDISSCATFAICCRRPCYNSNRGSKGIFHDDGPNGKNNIHNKDEGEEWGDGEAEDEFAVMVGIAPISPYLYRENDQNYDDDYNQQFDSLDDSSCTLAVEKDSANKAKKREGYYQSLAIEDDDDQYNDGISLSPLSILSPHLIIGTGGKSVDSAILLRRTIEMAVDSYATEDGGVGWFISHSLEGATTTGRGRGGEEEESNNFRRMEEEELWTPKGGVASVDVTSLVRRVADIAQISTQSLGGRFGRMLSCSLLALGSRDPTNKFVVDDESNSVNEGNIRSDPDNDTLILWRVDPTGQFWRLDASAIGRGCFEVEKEFFRRVNDWKKNTNGRSAQLEDNNYHYFPEVEEEDSSSLIHNNDVRAYLSSLSANDAVKLATDCLVNGIMNRRLSMQRRRRGRSCMPDSTVTERRNKMYERGLMKRVRAVIIRSNAISYANSGRSRRPYIEIVV